MPEARRDRLRSALDLLTSSDDICGVVLMTSDGQEIMNRCEQVKDARLFCAMTAAMLGAASTITNHLQPGALFRMTLELLDFKVVVFPVDERLLLAVVTRRSFDPEHGFERIRSVATSVKLVMDRDRPSSGA